MRDKKLRNQRNLQQMARLLVMITVVVLLCGMIVNHLYQREMQLHQRRVRLEEMRITLIELETERNELLAQINEVYRTSRATGNEQGEVVEVTTHHFAVIEKTD